MQEVNPFNKLLMLYSAYSYWVCFNMLNFMMYFVFLSADGCWE